MKFMKSTIFIVWIVAITILSIIPHANDGEGLSFKLTESGIFLHFGAYFIASALFYWAFRKNTLFSILIPSFTIFLYSVILEIVQLYLPYRSFNPVDIGANGFGAVFFVICWAVFFGSGKEELGNRKELKIDSKQKIEMRK